MSGAPRERKLSRRKKLLTVATVFGVLLGAYAWIAFTDISPIDDSDLALTYPDVSEDENAYTWLARAHDAEWNDDRARALECTLRAAECRVLAPPSDPSQAKHFGLGNYGQEFEDAIAREDYEACWQMFGAARTLTRLHSEHPEFFSTLSFLRFCDRQTSRAIRLATRDPSKVRLRHWLQVVEAPLLVPDWEARMHLREYHWFREGLFRDSGRGLVGPQWFLRRNRTAARLADVARRRLDGEVHPDRLSATPSFTQTVFWWLGGNVTGESYAHAFARLPSWIAGPLAQKALAKSALLEATIAVRIFFLDHGRYPERLEELVPGLSSRRLTDPFDPAGAPLRWDPNRRVLWSVGRDGIDDGGVATGPSGRGTATEARQPAAAADLTLVFPESPVEPTPPPRSP